MNFLHFFKEYIIILHLIIINIYHKYIFLFLTIAKFNHKVYNKGYAGVAQLVEQLIRNEQVACSSHVASSRKSQMDILIYNGRGELCSPDC